MFLNTPHPSRKPHLGSNVLREGANWLLFGRFKEHNEIRNNKIGYALLIVGFVLQLIAAF